MKKILFVLSIIFAILTFVGAWFVLASKGTLSAGYAVIPCVWTLICTNGLTFLKNKEKENSKNEETKQ